MERQFRILWGPTLETALDFAWPVVGDAPRVWRALRAGSERVVGATSVDVSVTGKDFFLGVTAKWFDLPHDVGATGLQAFIDWANAGNAFTLVPNTLVPALIVPGCFLDAPFAAPSWSVEVGGEMTVDLVIRHPTQDLGLAWRGLFFEYAAGQSLTDPAAFTYSRGSIGYEIGPDGYLHQLASGVPADGHYGDPLVGAGGQGTIIERAFTNDILNPEDLTNASWVKTRATITPNNANAPDRNVTADLVVEDTSVTQTHSVVSNSWAIASGDVVTVLAFVRSSGRYKGVLRLGETGGTANDFGVLFDLFAGTVSANVNGAGALIAASITPLAGGWSMIWMRGTVNGGFTSVVLRCLLADGTGTLAYTGDGASGLYLWGATVVHTAANLLAGYTPTSSSADLLYAPLPQTPVDLNNCTVYVKALRPFWADATGTFGVFPGLFAVGRGATATNPSLGLFTDTAARTMTALLRTGAGDSASAAQAIPAGASFDAIVQFKNLLTGGQAALDVGSGLGAFASAAPAISALGAQFIRIGQYDEQWNGGVAIIKVAPGLQTLADMRAR